MSAPTKCDKCGTLGTVAIAMPCAVGCGGTMHYAGAAPRGEAGAPEPMQQEICLSCGGILADHIGNTGVVYPCWKPSGQFRSPEVRAGASGGQECTGCGKSKPLNVHGYCKDCAKGSCPRCAGEERPSGPWRIEQAPWGQPYVIRDGRAWMGGGNLDVSDRQAEAIAVRDALNRVAAGTEGREKA